MVFIIENFYRAVVKILALGQQKNSILVRYNSLFETLKRWKSGEYEMGEVIQLCADWTKKVDGAFEKNPNKKKNRGSGLI